MYDREKRREYYLKNRDRFLAANLKWKAANKEKTREQNKRKRATLRKLCITAYGGESPSCNCCGETVYEFLVIDHKNNDGNIHRKTVSTGAFYGWLKKNNFPDGFQILCHNCNMSKSSYGTCPHESMVNNVK